jgi:L-asparaginase
MAATVTVLATGGTLATTTRQGQSAPRLGAAELASSVGVPGVALRPVDLMQVPSWAMDPATMASIARTARDHARSPDVSGVVVVHGTTTLEYTAFLTNLIVEGSVPVVFTGAMRRADHPEPDGPGNLADAVRVAMAPEARGSGALVVFAGRIIAGGRAWKAHRTALDAFVDLGGDLGRVSHGGVELGGPRPPHPTFSGRLETKVGYVKAVPGCDGATIDAAMVAGVRGLIVEGLPGVGGIPPHMRDALAAASARVPVVIASRAPYGAVPPEPTGGTGEPLVAFPLLSAGSLTAEQAWLLLMAALADGRDRAEAETRVSAYVRSQLPQDGRPTS